MYGVGRLRVRCTGSPLRPGSAVRRYDGGLTSEPRERVLLGVEPARRELLALALLSPPHRASLSAVQRPVAVLAPDKPLLPGARRSREQQG